MKLHPDIYAAILDEAQVQDIRVIAHATAGGDHAGRLHLGLGAVHPGFRPARARQPVEEPLNKLWAAIEHRLQQKRKVPREASR